MSTERQYCTFLVDVFYFGIPVEQVQEILRYQEMTPVPLAPREVEGLINLRGEIVTAVDLRRRLEIGDRPEGMLPTNVVTLTADGAMSFLADEIGDVVEVDESTSEPPPPTLKGVARHLISRVYKLDSRLLLVLDVERTADLEVVSSRRETRAAA